MMNKHTHIGSVAKKKKKETKKKIFFFSPKMLNNLINLVAVYSLMKKKEIM